VSLALFVALASCGRWNVDRGDASGADDQWAHEAVGLFDTIAQDLTDVDRYAAAAHFSGRGVLDLQAWGGELSAGRLDIAEALGKTLYIAPRAANGYRGGYPDLDVDVDQVFLGAHEAVVRFDAHVSAGVPWAQLYAVGDDGVASSRLYTEDLGHLDPAMRWTDAPVHTFYDRYIEVWSSEDERRLAEVYAGGVEVRDALNERRIFGLDALGRTMWGATAIEAGPWPELFRYDVGDRHEQIAVFQTGGSCPSLEARRWVFDDGVIVDETRYAHVPSVRRCQGSSVEGWWTGFEESASEEFAVDTVKIGGRQIDLVNAIGQQPDLARWLFERYATGSLDPPDVAAVWFPPSVDCSLAEGIAKSEDERFDGRHTVTLCFAADQLSAGWPNLPWPTRAVHQGLHELAHVWMYDHLDELDQRIFLARVGLDTWRDANVFWPERGIEVAAETIAWGLAGNQRAEYLIRPVPDCEELAARYVLLTGQDPLTTCTPRGGGG